MDLEQCLNTRRSIRAFTSTPVADETLQKVFTLAQRAASNCNTQPWKAYVVSGKACDALRKDLYKAASEDIPPNPYFGSIPVFQDEYKDRQYECALAMYGTMGITRSDKEGRRNAMLRNFELFDAPHAVFITMPTNVNINSAIDVGSYMQSLMLVMTANGIGSCAQGALALYPDIVRQYTGIPEGEGILVGLSFGYEREGAAVNKTITSRAGIDKVVQFFE